MTRVINLRTDIAKFPGQLEKLRKQWPFAVSGALNDTAFAARERLIAKAPTDMRFRGAPKGALGMQVKKATKQDLEATVGTPRAWVVSQVTEGHHTARRGFVHKGRKYLLVPFQEKGGRAGRRNVKIRKGAQTFIIESGGQVLLMERLRKKVRAIGTLHLQTEYGDEFRWDRHISDTMKREFEAAFDRHFAKAIATAR